MILNSVDAAIHKAEIQLNWQQTLAQAVRDPAELLTLLQLPGDQKLLTAAKKAAKLFPLRVPQPYLQRIKPADLNDPLLRQVLPLAEELENDSDFTADPVADQRAMVTPGLLHKYHGRALIISTGVCAIHCRYCFRREFPYPDATLLNKQMESTLRYLAAHKEINEIILSGGDPLVLSDGKLAALISHLESVKHLRRLRVHSRLPVVLPARITPALCDIFNNSRLQTIQVIHANHAQEFDNEVGLALDKLKSCSNLLLNQAVLLKGVNDSATAQTQLAETLISHDVQPYYLHMLDRVSGTRHFEVGTSRANEIMQQVRNSLPGYMVPQLVREIAGQPAKTPIPHRPLKQHYQLCEVDYANMLAEVDKN